MVEKAIIEHDIKIKYVKFNTGTQMITYEVNGKETRLPKVVARWIAKDYIDDVINRDRE